MKKIRVLIVEDNSMVSEEISITLKKHSLEVVDICRSGESAVSTFKDKGADLVLMDIELDGKMDGIEVASIILQHRPVPIIYLTDHIDDKRLKRAMATYPANYLPKPYDEAGLVRAIELAFNNAGSASGRPTENISKDDTFLLTASQQFERVYYKDVLYLQAARSYCDVITDRHIYTICNSMNHVQQENFGTSEFIRVHRSYVVNSKRITKLVGNIIFLNDKEVKMGKEYRDGLMNALKLVK
jgi:DNA-binding LytR/AlgR family response regulator